jgi:hypothetical protein
MKAKLEKQLVALPTDKEKFVNTLEAGVGGKYGWGSACRISLFQFVCKSCKTDRHPASKQQLKKG